MGSTDLGIVEDGLATAHEFISSVTAWTGHEDDLAEVLGAVDDALSRLESVRTTVELGAFRPAPQSAPPAES